MAAWISVDNNKLLTFTHPSDADEVKVDWTPRYQEALSSVAKEFQRVTEEIDKDLARRGLKDGETVRFNDLHCLLAECFYYVEESLKITPNSRAGVDQLRKIIANETDIVFMFHDAEVRLRVEYMILEQTLSRHDCFKQIAAVVIDRLGLVGCALPIELALRVMLEVIPDLDASTLQKVSFEDWYSTLNRHGMDSDAKALATALKGGIRTPSSLNLFRDTRSPSIPDSSAFYQVADRTPTQSEYGAPSAKSSLYGDD